MRSSLAGSRGSAAAGPSTSSASSATSRSIRAARPTCPSRGRGPGGEPACRGAGRRRLRDQPPSELGIDPRREEPVLGGHSHRPPNVAAVAAGRRCKAQRATRSSASHSVATAPTRSARRPPPRRARPAAVSPGPERGVGREQRRARILGTAGAVREPQPRGLGPACTAARASRRHSSAWAAPIVAGPERDLTDDQGLGGRPSQRQHPDPLGGHATRAPVPSSRGPDEQLLGVAQGPPVSSRGGPPRPAAT